MVDGFGDRLHTMWPELPEPLLYIASDDPSARSEFAEFSPITARDPGETIQGAEMYPDFHVLAQADVLAFSVAAAMLNERARSFLRREPRERRLVSFDPSDTTSC